VLHFACLYSGTGSQAKHSHNIAHIFPASSTALGLFAKKYMLPGALSAIIILRLRV